MIQDKQKESFGSDLRKSLKTLLEILTTIFLDGLLIIGVWWIRRLIIWVVGVEPHTITDPLTWWTVRISEVGVLVIITLYIMFDIYLHADKIYKEIKGPKESDPESERTFPYYPLGNPTRVVVVEVDRTPKAEQRKLGE